MRVIVGIDGSPASSVALDLIAGVDWPSGSSIRVVEAIEPNLGALSGAWLSVGMAGAEELEATVRESAREAVEAARVRLSRPGLQVSTDVVYGRPSTVLTDAATDLGADVIVVGSRGHGTIEAMLLGSVSAEVVDHATMPVLVARATSLERVVLGWDGSDGARAAAGLLQSWDVFAGSAIHVVSVADVEPVWWAGFPDAEAAQAIAMQADTADALRREHDGLAAEMAATLREAGRNAIPERRDGDAAAQLIDAARGGQADLVVVGTHGRTGLARLILGSVARNVLLHAPCSVLVTRSHGDGA